MQEKSMYDPIKLKISKNVKNAFYRCLGGKHCNVSETKPPECEEMTERTMKDFFTCFKWFENIENGGECEWFESIGNVEGIFRFENFRHYIDDFKEV